MTRWLCLLALVASCKNREVPFKPPADAAAAKAIDADVEVDAAVATSAKGATKVVVGDHWSCAILTDKSLRCWGRNNEGQLGTGSMTDSPAPVAPKVPAVLDIVLGTAHACVLLDDHSVSCWGRINFGHKENLLVPTGVPGVTKVRRIFAVGSASCATLMNGDFVCWGDVDLEGHLRLGGAAVEHRVPTPVDGLRDVAQLTVNGAYLENGTVMFWGADGIPQRTALADVVKIASSGDEVCGLRKDGTVACVGPRNVCAANAPREPAPKKPAATKPVKKPVVKKTTKKQVARKPAAKKPAAKPAEPKPEPKPKELPIEVLNLPPAKDLAFDVGFCVVTKAGALQCLDAGDGCKDDSPWPGLAAIERVSGRCAQLHDGTAKCWDVDQKSRVITAIEGVATARDLVVSTSHACVLRTDQKIVCWGSNKYGELGTGEIDDERHRKARAIEF